MSMCTMWSDTVRISLCTAMCLAKGEAVALHCADLCWAVLYCIVLLCAGLCCAQERTADLQVCNWMVNTYLP